MENSMDELIIKEKIEAMMGFQPIEFLGAGGSGHVYKCKRESYGIEQVSAVKGILIPKRIESLTDFQETYMEGLIRRVLMEVEANLRIGAAPNILALEDYRCEKLEDGRWILLIRMELAKTFSVEEALKRTRLERLSLVLELGRGLVECEKSEIIHGDIKPENIFIGRDQRMKIGDFGVVSLYSETSSVDKTESRGTPMYCTPELWRNGRKDKTMDLYSLGLVAYRLFNDGFLPFVKEKGVGNETEKQAFRMRLAGEPILPPVHGGEVFSRIIGKTIEKLPENRYKSSGDFCRELEKLIQSESEDLSLLDPRTTIVKEEYVIVEKAHNKEVEMSEKIGNLWNGDFVCFHMGWYLISDLINGGLYVTQKCRELRLIDQGFFFSLKSNGERVYGISGDGLLVEVRFLHELPSENIRIELHPEISHLKYLVLQENEILGITLLDEIIYLKPEKLSVITDKKRIEDGRKKDGQSSIRIESMLGIGKRCFRPIPYKNVFLHGGVNGAEGVFFMEQKSGRGHRLLSYEIRTMNRYKNKLLTVSYNGDVEFYNVSEIEPTMGHPDTVVKGLDIEYICSSNEKIFMQSASGCLFLYEKGTNVQLFKLP